MRESAVERELRVLFQKLGERIVMVGRGGEFDHQMDSLEFSVVPWLCSEVPALMWLLALVLLERHSYLDVEVLLRPLIRGHWRAGLQVMSSPEKLSGRIRASLVDGCQMILEVSGDEAEIRAARKVLDFLREE